MVVTMDDRFKFSPSHDLSLLDQVREMMGYKHYKYRTEDIYCDGIPSLYQISSLSEPSSGSGKNWN